MNLPPLILASASPRRSLLLQELGAPFTVRVTDAPEVEHDFLTPREVCQLNASRKAHLAAGQHPDALVLGADTVVCLGSKIFGKPVGAADAERTLSALQGRTHEVITGVCLFHKTAHRHRLFAVSTRVTFKKLTPAQIRAYLRKIHYLDKAGAYAIQEHGDLIIERISGSYSNVVGLPVERLRQELRLFEEANE